MWSGGFIKCTDICKSNTCAPREDCKVVDNYPLCWRNCKYRNGGCPLKQRCVHNEESELAECIPICTDKICSIHEKCYVIRKKPVCYESCEKVGCREDQHCVSVDKVSTTCVDICGPNTCQTPEEKCTVIDRKPICYLSCIHMYGGCHPSQKCIEKDRNVTCTGRNENHWRSTIDLKWEPALKMYEEHAQPRTSFHCAPNDNYFLSQKNGINCFNTGRLKPRKIQILKVG